MKMIGISDNTGIVNVYNNKKTEKTDQYPVYLFIKEGVNGSAA